jgi:uncharacterized protein YndB with AHSA1/START domain
VRGEYVEIDPPQRLIMTWGWEQADWFPEGMRVGPGATRVEISLVPDGEGTLLRLRHSQLSSEATREFHVWGWNLTLDRLASVASGGEPSPDPFAQL